MERDRKREEGEATGPVLSQKLLVFLVSRFYYRLLAVRREAAAREKAAAEKAAAGETVGL